MKKNLTRYTILSLVITLIGIINFFLSFQYIKHFPSHSIFYFTLKCITFIGIVVSGISFIVFVMFSSFLLFMFYIDRSARRKSTGEEAVEWLKKQSFNHSIAIEYFANNNDAIQFIQNLYKLGAVRVQIGPIEHITHVGQKFPYVDSLEIFLPKDKKQRAEIFKVVNKATDGNPEEDTGEEGVGIWWD